MVLSMQVATSSIEASRREKLNSDGNGSKSFGNVDMFLATSYASFSFYIILLANLQMVN